MKRVDKMYVELILILQTPHMYILGWLYSSINSSSSFHCGNLEICILISFTRDRHLLIVCWPLRKPPLIHYLPLFSYVSTYTVQYKWTVLSNVMQVAYSHILQRVSGFTYIAKLSGLNIQASDVLLRVLVLL